jgi:hypothetical protein
VKLYVCYGTFKYSPRVPLLITDDGAQVQGSQKIVDWAAANPAAG